MGGGFSFGLIPVSQNWDLAKSCYLNCRDCKPCLVIFLIIS